MRVAFKTKYTSLYVRLQAWESLRNSLLYLVGFSENDPNFSSIWLMSDSENGTWTWVGLSGPATSLRGNMCWVCDRDRVAGGKEGQFQEVTRKGAVSKGTVVMQI